MENINLKFVLFETYQLNQHHWMINKQNYYFFKGYLKYFRVPTIILSGMNSVFSVGLQPYISQSIISVLCCSISLICGIIASLELFVGIQNMMEKKLISSENFSIQVFGDFENMSHPEILDLNSDNSD